VGSSRIFIFSCSFLFCHLIFFLRVFPMAVVGLAEEDSIEFAWAGGVDGGGSGDWAFELEGWEGGWKLFISSMLGA
jgi:hypothetical protein